MKSFKEFQESVAQEVGGKSLTGVVLSGVSNLTKGPLNKAAKVANVFRSSKNILKDLFGDKDDPKPMKDVYNKDLTGNAKFDNKLDPTGEQKKPSLGKLRQGARIRRQQKRSQIKKDIKDNN